MHASGVVYFGYNSWQVERLICWLATRVNFFVMAIAKQMSRHPSIHWIVRVILGVAIVVCLLIPLVRPTRVAYHRWQFDRANALINDSFRTGRGVTEPELMPVKHHLSQLISMGEVSRIDFKFANITNIMDSPERVALILKLTTGKCPASLYWESPCPNDVTPLELTVWCDWEDTDVWNAFLDTEEHAATTMP